MTTWPFAAVTIPIKSEHTAYCSQTEGGTSVLQTSNCWSLCENDLSPREHIHAAATDDLTLYPVVMKRCNKKQDSVMLKFNLNFVIPNLTICWMRIMSIGTTKQKKKEWEAEEGTGRGEETKKDNSKQRGNKMKKKEKWKRKRRRR
jgi:hypothetical protein